MNLYTRDIIVKKQTQEIIEFLKTYINSIKELSNEVNRQQFINEIFSGSYLENKIEDIVDLYID